MYDIMIVKSYKNIFTNVCIKNTLQTHYSYTSTGNEKFFLWIILFYNSKKSLYIRFVNGK